VGRWIICATQCSANNWRVEKAPSWHHLLLKPLKPKTVAKWVEILPRQFWNETSLGGLVGMELKTSKKVATDRDGFPAFVP